MKTYGRKKTEDDNDVIVNLDDLCRLCLAKEEQLVPIFNDDEPISLPIRIMACVALEVKCCTYNIMFVFLRLCFLWFQRKIYRKKILVHYYDNFFDKDLLVYLTSDLFIS